MQSNMTSGKAPTISLAQLNAADKATFISTLSEIYESSSWVAEAVEAKRPFASVTALQAAMKAVVDAASPEQQMKLIRAHPRLELSKTGSASLTAHSKAEQTAVGLIASNEMDKLAQQQFEAYQQKYESKHGFPFIIAVLSVDRDAIFRSLGERAFNETKTEVKRAINEIHKIASLRLTRSVTDPNAACSNSAIPIGAPRTSAGTTIIDNSYGKSRVRVLKKVIEGSLHTVYEIEAQVLLRGDLNSSFTRGDNAIVVPTDTVKNTVLILSRSNLNNSLEDFGMSIGSHFLTRYSHLSSVDIHLTEKVWQRMEAASESSEGSGVFNGPKKPHNHVFQLRGPERPFTHVVARRDGIWIESGITEYTVMKSTASGFTRYHQDQFTTLPSTEDRILATKINATWNWNSIPSKGFRAANASIMEWMLNRFATRYSVSVQATEYEMALDALGVCPQIDSIAIALPNIHFIPFNLQPFQLPNENVVFVPTDEPHGTIKIQVGREKVVKSTNVSEQDRLVLGALAGTKATAPLLPMPKL